MIKLYTSLILAGTCFIAPSADAYIYFSCREKEEAVLDVIERVKTMQMSDKKPDRFKGDLARLYIIYSVHDHYVFCEPMKIYREPTWGYFAFEPPSSYSPTITWDGEIKSKERLSMAREQIESLYEGGDRSSSTKMLYAWVLEKQGKLHRALELYEDVFKMHAEGMKEDFFCLYAKEDIVCGSLNRVLESLGRMISIHRKLGNKKQAKELLKLRLKYIWKLPAPNNYYVSFLVVSFLFKIFTLLGFVVVSLLVSLAGKLNRQEKQKLPKERLLWPF